jgi:hypothetical protein
MMRARRSRDAPHLFMDDGRLGSRGEQLSDRIGAGAGQRSRWPRRQLVP